MSVEEGEELTQSSGPDPTVPSQTQAEVKGLISSIFGDDSDDDDNDDKIVTSKYNIQDDDEDNDDLADSDDEGVAKQKRRRLSKLTSNASKGDSNLAPKSKSLKKLKVLKSKKDDHDKDDEDRNERRSKKLKKLSKSTDKSNRLSSLPSSSREGKGGKGDSEKQQPTSESGDEYDSGEEVEKTAEDDNFIDREEDDDELVREYEEEEQNFEDERPLHGSSKLGSKSKNKNTSSNGSGGGSGYISKKDTDPLSQTMEMLKKPKDAVMTDTEKARIATELMTKMDTACREDDECYRTGKPALHKLNLLPTVKKLVGMKQLQTTLLEYDILNVFKDWIEPKDSKTLTSLAVRTAIYDMLHKLPCTIDQLKRAPPGKQPIGATIVALRKHTAETSENKKLLKDIMEKWSRPIFGKSIDPRSMIGGRENYELKEIALLRQQQQIDDQRRQNEEKEKQMRDIMNGTIQKPKDEFSRVRTPYSNGFLFTVQPEYKQVKNIGESDKGSSNRVSREDTMGESRQQLLKLMKETGKKVAVTGIKHNPRAISMALNGRNKS